MAKTIKFNLTVNDRSIRTLEDLRDNFCIEDMLDVFRNGLLKKWLSVRGYNVELEKVSAISDGTDTDIIKQLIMIFELDVNENKLFEDIYVLRYKKAREIELEEFKNLSFETNRVIHTYHDGYQTLIDQILENKYDMRKIKACINELCEKYMELFSLHFPLFFTTIYDAPLAIFAMLMRDELRPYLIYDESSENSPANLYIKSIDNRIKELVLNKRQLKEYLGDELLVFKGQTDGYWKDIESKDKRYMIISMQDSYSNRNFVRNAGVTGEELTAVELNDCYVILDGIDYKSNSMSDELLYMEV